MLEQQSRGKQFTIRSFELNTPRGPEDGATLYALVDSREQAIGSVNCSAWSETLGSMIGNASIKDRYGKLESAWTEVDGENVTATLSNPPLLKFERARQVPAQLR